MWDEITHSQTSFVQPLTFGNESTNVHLRTFHAIYTFIARILEFNILEPRQKGRQFPGDFSKRILNENI